MKFNNIIFSDIWFNDKPSAWIEHYAFAFFLVEKLRPNVFVELGTHYGGSYFSFCQAIKELQLKTKAHAVDNWLGDEHAGFYGQEVFNYVSKINNEHFSYFSNLIKATFDEASHYFENGSIDLLHIDGLHTYEAVKHDFEIWLPKMSDKGVIVFHDTVVKEGGFGVWKLMDELKKIYPYFEFEHGYGLGVLCTGNNISKDFLTFIETVSDDFTKNLFSTIGRKNLLEFQGKLQNERIELLSNDLESKNHENKDLNLKIEQASAKNSSLLQNNIELKMQHNENITENEGLQREIERFGNANQNLQDNIKSIGEQLKLTKHLLASMTNSVSWKITSPLRKLSRFIKFRFPFLFPQTRLIQKSGLFNEHYYLQNNPDVKESGMEAAQHFLLHGGFEDRNPSEFFDSAFYLNQYPDVKLANINPLLHYLLHGKNENRITKPETFRPTPFDKEKFLKHKQTELFEFLQSSEQINLTWPEPQISVILVLYNKAELTYACLKSLQDFADVPLEIIVIDNHSTDQTEKLLKKINVSRVIRNNENLHFLKACNQALEFVSTPNILFLNNDTEISDNAISSALDTLNENENHGAVGAKLILPDGTLQEAGNIIWRDGSCLSYGRGDDPNLPEYNFRRSVDYCSGAFLLTRTSLFKKHGGFDTQFAPAYYEETDYCLWLQENGFRVVYNSFSEVHHFEFGSSDKSKGVGLQEMNREKFIQKHDDTLNHHFEPATANILKARFSASGQPKGNILYIDDRVPHASLGAGYPRSNFILNAFSKFGYHVTMYPNTFPQKEDGASCYNDIKPAIEVIFDMGTHKFNEFIQNRSEYYDFIWISRPHNLKLLYNQIKEYRHQSFVIYDAEAIFAEREFQKEKLMNPDLNYNNFLMQIEDEVNLCRIADQVVAVSERDAEIFKKHAVQNISVLGHALKVQPGNKSFEDRNGLLFVGNLDYDDSPNVDSIIWFAKEVFPIIKKSNPEMMLHVIGSNKAVSLQNIDDSNIIFHGMVNDISPFYNSQRVFIAPTRFAAGIPFKIHEAASKGLPVVATELLARQLGWQDGELLLCRKPAKNEFAEGVLKLYQQKQLWTKIQQQALREMEKNHSEEKLINEISKLLDNKKQNLKNAQKLNVQANKQEDFDGKQLYPGGHYYSPIVSQKEILKNQHIIWRKNILNIKGINLNTKEQIDLVNSFYQYYPDIPFTDNKTSGLRYYFDNGFYSYTDAIFLYSIIRHHKPSRIIEVGSGFSSMVMLDTNELFFKNNIFLTFIDPNPDRLNELIRPDDRLSTEIYESNVQDIPAEIFEELKSNDVLFIDGSHIVKTGSDVNYILFEILPRLNKGVLVHFHDIFFPFEYPKDWVFEGRNWNECYFIKAFLMYNPQFKIVLFSDYLHKYHSGIFKGMPLCYKNHGGNLWIEKID